MDCLFCQISQKKIPAKICYEDAHIIAFDDINAQAPYHKLIIPREHIPTINDLQPAHNLLIGNLYQVAKQLAQEYGVERSGYRIVMNCNGDGGQEVFHIHAHFLAGRAMQWPPG